MNKLKLLIYLASAGIIFSGCLKKTTDIPQALIVDYIRITGEAASGDLQILRNILVENAELEARQDSRLKPIHVAAWKKSGDDLTTLSDYQLRRERNKKTVRRWTPLHFAALSGNEDFARRLLAVGAKANKKDHAKMTPLHVAAAAGHANIVRALIDAGAPVNAESRQGWTPHAMAARGGHAHTAKLLREKCAALGILDFAALNLPTENQPGNATNIFGETALHLALLWHPESIDTQLKNRGLVNTSAIYKITPLHLATLSGEVKVVSKILACGADTKTPPGVDSPLHWAAKNGHVEIINALLDRGADLNGFGYPRVALSLKKDGQDQFVMIVDTKNEQADLGWSPLHCAVYFQQEEAVRVLLARGADANFKTSAKNDTPLHWAAFNGDIKIAKELLAAGARKNTATPKPPCAVALAKEHKELGKLLMPE